MTEEDLSGYFDVVRVTHGSGDAVCQDPLFQPPWESGWPRNAHGCAKACFDFKVQMQRTEAGAAVEQETGMKTKTIYSPGGCDVFFFEPTDLTCTLLRLKDRQVALGNLEVALKEDSAGTGIVVGMGPLCPQYMEAPKVRGDYQNLHGKCCDQDWKAAGEEEPAWCALLREVPAEQQAVPAEEAADVGGGNTPSDGNDAAAAAGQEDKDGTGAADGAEPDAGDEAEA